MVLRRRLRISDDWPYLQEIAPSSRSRANIRQIEVKALKNHAACTRTSSTATKGPTSLIPGRKIR